MKSYTPPDYESYREHIEEKKMQANRAAAEEFLKRIIAITNDYDGIADGLTLLFDLFSRPEQIADVRDLVDDLQLIVFSQTMDHSDAFQSFVSNIRQRESWLEGK